METVIGGALGVITVYLVGKGLRRLPHLWRRSLEIAGIFLFLVATVMLLGAALASVIAAGATFTGVFGLSCVIAAGMVFCAYLALQVMMRLFIVARLHDEHERERRARFYAELGE